MRKIVFKYSTGYAGMDGIDFFEVADDVTDEMLSDAAWHRAVEHAEHYGVYLPSEDAEEYDEEYDELDGSNIDGWWEEYDPEEHDGQVPGGGLPEFGEL